MSDRLKGNLMKYGITSGIGGGLFGTSAVCSRAQIVTFLYKAYN